MPDAPLPKTPLPDVPESLVRQAVDILGAEGATEADIEQQMLALAQDSMLARRLIEWPPEAFGMLAAAHVVANIALPTTFSARTRHGKWVDLPFSVEPIFAPSLVLATQMLHSGSRESFNRVAMLSSAMGVLSRALHEGVALEGGRLSGPALLGIPAEVYGVESKSFWRRLFS